MEVSVGRAAGRLRTAAAMVARPAEPLDKVAARVHIPNWKMSRSITALFFILAIAAQAMAGVCNCLDSGKAPRHSCCKPSKSPTASASPKGCCDEGACKFTNESFPQNKSEATAGNLVVKQQILTNPAVAWPVFASFVIKRNAAHRTVERPPNLYARPPDLYLLHNSFLI